MYSLILISIWANSSEIRELVSSYREDISLVCDIFGALAIVVTFLLGLMRYLSKNPISKTSTPMDAEALVEYKKIFHGKGTEKA